MFKTYEDRKAAGDQIANDVKRLEEAMSKFNVQNVNDGSASVSGNAATSRSDRESWDLIAALSELLRLQDPAMLALELATITHKFPSVNPQDLRNVLAMRGDLPNKDINEVYSDIFAQLFRFATPESPHLLLLASSAAASSSTL